MDILLSQLWVILHGCLQLLECFDLHSISRIVTNHNRLHLLLSPLHPNVSALLQYKIRRTRLPEHLYLRLDPARKVQFPAHNSLLQAGVFVDSGSVKSCWVFLAKNVRL